MLVIYSVDLARAFCGVLAVVDAGGTLPNFLMLWRREFDMLDRFRDLVKRLELPQEDAVVYRIIDDELNAVEVTQSQYTRWRLQHDVARRAVVGQDIVDDVMVRTTFSIMPENRGYKPFGTSAYGMTLYDALPQYSQRYDTWREAEAGHRQMVERIRHDNVKARTADDKAQALSGTAGAVRLAVTEGLPALFMVHVHSDDEVTVHTPMRRMDGAPINVAVSVADSGFRVSASINAKAPVASALLTALDVKEEEGSVTYEVDGEEHLPQGIIRVAQAVACISASEL